MFMWLYRIPELSTKWRWETLTWREFLSLWFGSYTGTWIDELFREEQIFTKIKFMPLRVNMGGKMVWLVVAKMVPNKPSLVAASLEKQTKSGQTLIIGKWEISSVDYSILWFGYPS